MLGAQANFAAMEQFVARNREWVTFLAEDPTTRSHTSVCLQFPTLDARQVARMATLLEEKGVAYDIKSYRDAPPGLR